MELKLGKKPATPKATDLKFKTYLDTAELPAIPTNFGYDAVVKTDAWGMMGNDKFGDCVFAGAVHEHMMWTATESTQRPSPTIASFTEGNALDAYSAVTGFDPNDPETDQGTNVHDALRWRQKTGLTDANGGNHKIAAYLSLDVGNMTELFQALYVCEAVGIGFNFPSSAMDQFDAGQPWDVVQGAQIEGGHYVPVLSRQGNNTVRVITWGKRQVMTDAFYKKYCDEAWAIISADMLNTKGISARGFNLTQLQADLAAL